MLKLGSTMIGTAHPKALAAFYEKVFGKSADWAEAGWYAWDTGVGFLMVGKHSAIKGKSKEPQRIMFNFDTRQVKKEFKRLEELGAKVIAKPYQMDGEWIATLADPDGNYFQLVTPWEP